MARARLVLQKQRPEPVLVGIDKTSIGLGLPGRALKGAHAALSALLIESRHEGSRVGLPKTHFDKCARQGVCKSSFAGPSVGCCVAPASFVEGAFSPVST